MIRNRFLTVVSSALFAVSAFGDVDLAPRFYTVNFGTNTVRVPYFVDGDKKYAILVDGETEVTGERGGALFRFSSIPQATVQWSRSPFPATTGFGAEALPGP